MHCAGFENEWQVHLDGELPAPPSDRAVWADHLAACPRCQAADRRFRALSLALTRPAAANLPPHRQPARASLRQAALTAVGPARRPSHVRTSGWLASGLAVAAAACWVFLGPHKPLLRLEHDPVRPVEAIPEAGLTNLAQPLSSASSTTARLVRVALASAPRIRDAFPTGEANALETTRTSTPAEPSASRSRGLRGQVLLGLQPISARAVQAFEFVIPDSIDEPGAHDAAGWGA